MVKQEIDIVALDDYIVKVIKQAYKSILKDGEVDMNNVEHCIFVANNIVYVNWKLLKYNSDAHKIAVKVRYRLERNLMEHFNVEHKLITRRTVDTDSSIRAELEAASEILVSDSKMAIRICGVLGEELYKDIKEKIIIKNA